MEQLVKNILNVVGGEDKDVATENANKSAERFSTQRDLIAGEVAKYITHEYMLPKHISAAHKAGEVHLHDLDYAPLMGYTNCCLVNLKDMLENGCNMNEVGIESPKGISTAMTIASQIVAAIGGDQYGGISYNRFDEVMGKYVEMSYEKHLCTAREWNISDEAGYAMSRTRKEVEDACQTLEYQLNTIHSTSGMSPFITINFGLGLSWSEKLVQEMLLKIRTNGLGKDKVTAIFPKLIYTLRKGINLESCDPNYDIKRMSLECASKRMYPDIINYDQVVEVTGGFKSSMSCRSFLSECYDEDGNPYHDGRTNLGVQTINLPLIAMDAGKDKVKFWELLEQRIQIAKDACEFRLEYLSKVQAKSAPTLYMEGGLMRLDAEEYVLPHLLKRGSSISIGYIGLNEMVNAMFGTKEHMLDSKEKQDFAELVLRYLDERVKQFKTESGVGYSSYATPSESQCKRLRDVIYNKYGLVEGVTDKEYLTNSFHLEASKKTDVFTRMEFERKFIPFSTGGFISYGELPCIRNNIDALEAIWDKSYYVTPYYAINTPADNCFECGFEGKLLPKRDGYCCPQCSNRDPSKYYVVDRVSGYLGNPSARPFNDGKTAEVRDRVYNI